MPANDGRRPHIDHRIAPIEEPRKQREAHTSRMFHPSGFDTALIYHASCLRRTRFSARIALDGRKNRTTSLKMSEMIPTTARANCSMCSSCQSRPAFAGTGHGGDSGANYCGPQLTELLRITSYLTPMLAPTVVLIVGACALARDRLPDNRVELDDRRRSSCPAPFGLDPVTSEHQLMARSATVWSRPQTRRPSNFRCSEITQT